MLAKFTKANPLPPQPVHSYRTRCSTGDAPRPCIQLKFHYAPRALNSLQKGSRSQDSKGRASPDGEPYPALLVFGQALGPVRRPGSIQRRKVCLCCRGRLRAALSGSDSCHRATARFLFAFVSPARKRCPDSFKAEWGSPSCRNPADPR